MTRPAGPAPAPRLPPASALPLLLAAWAALERCHSGSDTARHATAHPGTLQPPDTPAAFNPATACPVDTLLDRGLCLPIPAAPASADAVPR